MLRFLILLLSFIAFALAAKPMESIKNYNVILVHGAADKRSGLDCAGDSIKAVSYYDSISVPTEYLTRVGGYQDLSWFWEENFHGGFLFQDTASNATGMVSELNEWLTENIFENDKRAVYLQRPLSEPELARI